MNSSTHQSLCLIITGVAKGVRLGLSASDLVHFFPESCNLLLELGGLCFLLLLLGGELVDFSRLVILLGLGFLHLLVAESFLGGIIFGLFLKLGEHVADELLDQQAAIFPLDDSDGTPKHVDGLGQIVLDGDKVSVLRVADASC